MTLHRILFFTLILISPLAQSAPSNSFGLNVGIGLPYLGQVGAHYYFTENLSLSGTYNILDIDVGEASAKLTMPEVMINYHPFSGTFFVGAGVGSQSLEVTAVDTLTSNQATAEVSSLTTILKTGWKWGAANGGFWFGMDVAYIIPASADVTITAPGVPTTSQEYRDVVDAADKFGETAYLNFTFIRLGWLF